MEAPTLEIRHGFPLGQIKGGQRQHRFASRYRIVAEAALVGLPLPEDVASAVGVAVIHDLYCDRRGGASQRDPRERYIPTFLPFPSLLTSQAASPTIQPPSRRDPSEVPCRYSTSPAMAPQWGRREGPYGLT